MPGLDDAVDVVVAALQLSGTLTVHICDNGAWPVRRVGTRSAKLLPCMLPITGNQLAESLTGPGSADRWGLVGTTLCTVTSTWSVRQPASHHFIRYLHPAEMRDARVAGLRHGTESCAAGGQMDPGQPCATRPRATRGHWGYRGFSEVP